MVWSVVAIVQSVVEMVRSGGSYGFEWLLWYGVR